jgi:multidrug resistance protein
VGETSSRTLAVGFVTVATFVDILAYSIAVPVLPHLSQRFGASPTLIGLLFASFGVTVLAVSVPMGSISDRTGRRLPLAGGMVALAAGSGLFAVAPSMPWLFAARLVQGAADAVTWVVGFALVADLYTARERGRIMGFVMSGSTLGFMVGPTLGGWLYERGGARMPYLVVAALALVTAAAFAALRLPRGSGTHEAVALRKIFKVRAVMVCALAVAVGGGTIAMIEPVLSLFLASKIALGPGRIGLVFGAGAVVATALHPVFGRIADRTGGRRLTLWGLVAIAAALPLSSAITSFESAMVIYAVAAIAIAILITPSLTYMAEATSLAGSDSFGVAYGLYNFAWSLGLLAGPALGGALYERIGFVPLCMSWAIGLLAIAVILARASGPSPARQAVNVQRAR